MSQIKDHTPPGNGKESRKSPKSAGGEPWKINEDGTKQRASRALPYANRISELLAGASGTALLAGDQFTAQAIAAKSPELAYGWAKLAQSDPRVKRVLEALFEGSAWAEALIPTIGLVIVVGWHYGMVPDRLGAPLSVASGLIPVSREQEKEARVREARQRSQSRSQKSEGE